MIRFDDCETTRRAVLALLNSTYSDRIYQYIGGAEDNVCDGGQKNLAIFISN